jgi:hypothetical protein
MNFFSTNLSKHQPYVIENKNINKNGIADRNPFDLMSKPSPVFINNGNSTSNMNHPKLLHVWDTSRAKNGTEVKIDIQGIGPS